MLKFNIKYICTKQAYQETRRMVLILNICKIIFKYLFHIIYRIKFITITYDQCLFFMQIKKYKWISFLYSGVYANICKIRSLENQVFLLVNFCSFLRVNYSIFWSTRQYVLSTRRNKNPLSYNDVFKIFLIYIYF